MATVHTSASIPTSLALAAPSNHDIFGQPMPSQTVRASNPPSTVPPPITAYSGLQSPPSGSTNARRVASYQAHAQARQALNAPTLRRSGPSASGSGAAGSVPSQTHYFTFLVALLPTVVSFYLRIFQLMLISLIVKGLFHCHCRRAHP